MCRREKCYTQGVTDLLNTLYSITSDILAMAVVMLPYLATNVPGNTINHHNETCCLYWFAITPPCLGLSSTPSCPTLYSAEAVPAPAPAPAMPAEVGLQQQNLTVARSPSKNNKIKCG